MGEFSLRHHIEDVSGAHRSSCPMGNEWSVANNTALHRSSGEGSERLEFRFHHPPVCMQLLSLKCYAESTLNFTLFHKTPWPGQTFSLKSTLTKHTFL